MKEIPILFNGAMVRAILDGRKTVTRRPIKVPRWYEFCERTYVESVTEAECTMYECCPCGRPGDTLWVRETSRVTVGGAVCEYRADYPTPAHEPSGPKWTPSILMPRDRCRLLLRVTSVRREHLSAIDDAGARADGFADREAFLATWRAIYGDGARADGFADRKSFLARWHQVPGDGDPWVWVVGFEALR